MTRRELQEAAFVANRALAGTGLVFGTFGNVSVADQRLGELAIKPSGVPYEQLTPDTMVVVSLETAAAIDSSLRPSSDTPTHLELYRAFSSIGGVVHTHSEYATAFAQARQPIRCMGTTHADYFCVDVPVTRPMTREEVESEYERNTGVVIVETIRACGRGAGSIGAILVASHGPFTWGRDASAAIERAAVLEYLARVEWRARTLAPGSPRPDPFLVDKHFRRKHGPAAYYGQGAPDGDD